MPKAALTAATTAAARFPFATVVHGANEASTSFGSVVAEPRFALFIDADNTADHPAFISELLAEIACEGMVTVRRVYGDFTTTDLRGWKSVLHQHAINPVQQFAIVSGKNATDSALIIDAMDLLHGGGVDGFVIVSSDSDFTRLACRLREGGKRVLGVGRAQTPKPFVAAVDRFIEVEVLKEARKEATVSENEIGGGASEAALGDGALRAAEADKLRTLGLGLESSTSRPAPPSIAKVVKINPAHSKKLRKQLQQAIESVQTQTGGNEWVNISLVKTYLMKVDPSFDERKYDGCSQFKTLLMKAGVKLQEHKTLCECRVDIDQEATVEV